MFLTNTSIDHPWYLLRHSLRCSRHFGWECRSMHDRGNLAVLRTLALEQPPQKRGHHGSRSAVLRSVLDLQFPVAFCVNVFTALALRRQDCNHAIILRGAVHMGPDCRPWRWTSVLHPQQHHQRLVDRVRLLLNHSGHHRRQRHLRSQHGRYHAICQEPQDLCDSSGICFADLHHDDRAPRSTDGCHGSSRVWRGSLESIDDHSALEQSDCKVLRRPALRVRDHCNK